ncbi:glycogen debranching protein [Solirubrobacter sp. CPCC 204708]|nr:glycogen debranching protein [Solirubrobacter deserti]
MVLAALPVTAAQAADEVSTTDRLKDRREVAAGDRAYAVGFQDGGWYANGWHITGEMGGIWAPPLKLADGVWFGVDDQWVGPATRFTSGRGYVRYELPAINGVKMTRTDFVPDGVRGALFGLTLTGSGTHTVKVDVHSELLTAYPWTSSQGHPTASDNGQDAVTAGDGVLTFSDGPLTAFAGSDTAAVGVETGPGHRGPRTGIVCADGNQSLPSGCDDGPVGRGTGGQLRYQVNLDQPTTLWFAVAATREDLRRALANPDEALRDKYLARTKLHQRSRVSLPGNRTLQNAVDYGKQNLADLTQTAENLQLRFVDRGKAYPRPIGALDRVTFIGAGYPDYPWLFATDGEYTAFAAVALGQFEPIKSHLIALQQVSDRLNAKSGKVAHEIVTDGSVYFGANTDPGNTDESVKFPSAVALVWRWSGDNRFLNRLYDFSRRATRYVVDNLDADKDGWPEGLGNVEREGMGEEKLDNTVYLIRGLTDLAAMAEFKRDRATLRWAAGLADRLRGAFDRTWWSAATNQYGDSLDAGNRPIVQQHWTGVTPMEIGLAPRAHADAALDVRESDCFSGFAPFNLGMFHTGCTGGPEGKGERTVFSLNTAIKAVADGEYGRAESQRRYTDANAAGVVDEQPGALPEILPSPDQNRNIDRCWTCRSMFMQAWGHYGTAWPVIAQQLGVRPSVGERRLDVVANVGADEYIAGNSIRLGERDTVAVRALQDDRIYETRVTYRGERVRMLRIGATVPRRPKRVWLDGERVRRPQVRRTNQGIEVVVRVPGRVQGRHLVTVET